MGMDATARLCFGVGFSEGYELPWGEQDIDDWWLDTVLQWKPSKQVYDQDWKRIAGVTDIDARTYWDERKAFRDAHQCPIDVTYAGSYDNSQCVIHLPGTYAAAHWTYEKVNIPTITDEQIAQFKTFFTQHTIKTDDEPSWLLIAFYG